MQAASDFLLMIFFPMNTLTIHKSTAQRPGEEKARLRQDEYHVDRPEDAERKSLVSDTNLNILLVHASNRQIATNNIRLADQDHHVIRLARFRGETRIGEIRRPVTLEPHPRIGGIHHNVHPAVGVRFLNDA